MTEELIEAAAPVEGVTETVETPPQETTSSVEHDPSDKISVDMHKTYDRLNPPRGEAGKFAGKQTQELPEQQITAPGESKAPNSWKREYAAHWDKLPKEVQDYIGQREAEYHRKISELGTAKESLGNDELTAVMGKYEGNIPRSQDGNMPAAHAVLDYFLGLDHLIRSGSPEAKANIVRQIAARAGVNLDSQSPHSAEMEQVRAEYATFHQQQEQMNKQREQHYTDAIEKFAEGKEHWGQIEDEIFRQLVALKTENYNRVMVDPMGALKQAEERAMKIVGVEDRNAAFDRATEMKRKADEARRHASFNIRSSYSTSVTPAFKSLEDEMAHTYDRIQGR